MSAGWSKLLDVGPLADGRAQHDFAIPLQAFPRLLPQLLEPTGEATGSVGFGRENGVAVADVRVRARVQLRCQRCLTPMDWLIDGGGRVAMVACAADVQEIPPELETILAPEHRISLLDLVEEELLLALPLVPRHARTGCAGDGAGAQGPAPDETGAQERAPAEAGARGAAPDEAGAQQPALDEAAAQETQRPFRGLAELLKRR